MNGEESILETVRNFVAGKDNKEFDDELVLHINSSIVKLNQNGVGNNIFVISEEKSWNDLKDETQIEGNKSFQMVPLYITLSTQLLFDPPPPSNVEYHSKSADELLWRLKIAYEEEANETG